MKSFLNKSIKSATVFCVCSLSGINPTQAAVLDISNVPLFLSSKPIQPNIFFLIDDSGSMNWELMRSNEAQLAWPSLRNDANSRNLSPAFDFTPNTGVEYLELCAGYNTLAYDPTVTYTPWDGEDEDGNAYVNQSISSARKNPYDPDDGTTNLTGTDSGNNPYGYMPWNDADNNKVYSVGECADTNSGGSLSIDSSKFVPVSSMSATQKTNFANWYSYYRIREYVAKKAVSALIAGSSARIGLGTLHNNNSVRTVVSDMTNTTKKNTLLDNLSDVYSNGGTPLRTKLKDVGEYFKGNGGIFSSGTASPILAANQGGECQQNFAVVMSDGFWNGSSPGVGNEDGGTSDSAFDGGAYADNVSNSLADVAMKYFEEDLSSAHENKVSPVDGNSAQHLVTYTVAFGVNGNLTQNPTDPEVAFDDPVNGLGWPLPDDGVYNSTDKYELKADKATTIDDMRHAAYNGRGLFLNAGSPETLINSLNETFTNIDERSSSAAAVATNSTSLNNGSFVYQARFNSEKWDGQLRALPISLGFKATKPSSPCDKPLGFVCDENPDWDTSSATGLFNGQEPDKRVILTYNPSSSGAKGVPFRWPNITSLSDSTISQAQVDALLVGAPPSATISNQVYGGYLINYLRGGASTQGDSPTIGFRKRSSKLGDIINSAPSFVGAPSFLYPDTINGTDFQSAKYSDYKSGKAGRTGMLYVGANDGMLHGFAATGSSKGKELMAYVPNFVYKNLPALASQSYTHKYYVDGTPTVGDAFYSNAWHTVLVSGANAGGQGVFALDVTNPQNFSESNASSTVLWEFGDLNTNSGVNEGEAGATGDSDLGYTFSRPDIVKLNNGAWVAVFGNGYNNTVVDGSRSAAGHAALYIVNISTGALIKKISVPTAEDTLDNPNGLGTVTPVDINRDFDVDYIYAGDLRGNLWKFDLTGTPSQWDVAYHSGSGVNLKPEPLFTAISPEGNPQPITNRPSVSFQLDTSREGFIVYFGTGKYLEKTDNSVVSQDTQTFYGIWDNGTTVSGRSDLLKQEIILEPEVTSGGNDYILRVTTSNSIDWDSERGWYLDLINKDPKVTPDNRGERQITNPVYRNGRIIFTTLLPSESLCDFGGTSFLMELDAETGGRLPEPPFDLNNDGDFDGQDAYTYTDENGNVVVIPPSGRKYQGVVSTPTIIGCAENECKQMSNTSGNIDSVYENTGGNVGRQSWRQLFR